MYTVEIAGQPTAVINASKEEIETSFQEEWFIADWTGLESAGKPLWSGKLKDVFLRQPSEDEVARWRARFEDAVKAGEVTVVDKDGYLVFLVPVSPPADEDQGGKDE